MSRVRMVNGTMDDLLHNAGLVQVDGVWKTQAEVDAEAKRQASVDLADKKPEPVKLTSGSLSDPVGMLQDALGRFEDVPDRDSTKAKARQLVKEHAMTDADGKVVRFTVPLEPDLDVVIVCHPVPEIVRGVDGEDIEVDRWLVFGRTPETVRGTCYTCNNASRQGKAPKRHDCWRNKTWLEWTPFCFAWGHGIDDAEDLAKELRSAWQATAEMKYANDSNAMVNWSAQYEVPFSTDFVMNNLVGQQNAWDTLSKGEPVIEEGVIID